MHGTLPTIARGTTKTSDTRPIGSRVGDYTIVRHLDSGGMADIYLATAPESTAIVALKSLREENMGDRDYRRMILDEAALMDSLRHPNVVCVHDISRVRSGYFTMEYVHGAPLLRAFRKVLAQGRSFPVDVAVSVTLRVAAALHHAHDLRDEAGELRNLVHRDVSMGNILIGFDGAVKLTDFGVAKATGRLTKTRAGYLKGKIAYMSPEQVLGRQLDRRSDVFSLGIVLWELLAGKKLFDGKTDYERMSQIATAPTPQICSYRSGVPAAIEAVARRALARDVGQRYQTALEFIVALAGATRDQYSNSSDRVAAWMSALLPREAGARVAKEPAAPAAEAKKLAAPAAETKELAGPAAPAEDEDDQPSIVIEYGNARGASTRAMTLQEIPRTRSKPRGRLASYLGYPNSDDIAAFFQLSERG